MPRTYSLPEAAAMLGVRPDTMSTQARRGKLRARKVGRDWRVSESEIERYRSESLGRYLPRKSEIGGPVGKSETPEKSEPAKRASRGNGEKSGIAERFGAPRPAPKPRKKG